MEANQHIELIIEGMHCAGCVSTVEKALQNVAGVKSVLVNLTLEKAKIEGDADPEKLIEAVKATGYGVNLIDPGEKDSTENLSLKTEQQISTARHNIVIAWGLTIPAMLWMFVEMVFGVAWPTEDIFHLGMIIISGFVLFLPGKETMKSAWLSSIHRNPNMDVLIAMGSLAALSTGFLGFYFPLHSFAGIAGMIMAFHLTGRFIETRARGRSSESIRKLMDLEAKQALVVDGLGVETVIDVRDLKIGQVMIVRAGENIPTDGIVVGSSSAVDESMVTGESLPVTKGPNDEVIGGTISIDGTLKVEVTRVGKETFLSHVIKMVETAQNTKVPIQIFADKIVSVFVPIILGFAVLTFIVWLVFPGAMKSAAEIFAPWVPWLNLSLTPVESALFAAIAVLVIACPCALGLATPTALMVGSGLGAENGILIRDGGAIQRMKEITTIMFDKTGTLTDGKMEVIKIKVTGKYSADELLQLAASVEKESTHPLAWAIVRFAERKEIALIPTKDVKVVPGQGVSALVNGREIKVGNLKFVSANSNEKANLTVVYISVDSTVYGFIEFVDSIKKDAIAAINELKQRGIRCVMLTGDRSEVAESFGEIFGITEVHAEVLPGEKAGIISRYQDQGEIVAMVGDGINDAPALTQADVGIALGTGTDIAIESGDIVLVKGDLGGVVRTAILAEATFKKIKQNLFWAFIYNVIALPMAFLGLLHPIIAEGAMALSSINVVGNSNRLRRKHLS